MTNKVGQIRLGELSCYSNLYLRQLLEEAGCPSNIPKVSRYEIDLEPKTKDELKTYNDSLIQIANEIRNNPDKYYSLEKFEYRGFSSDEASSYLLKTLSNTINKEGIIQEEIARVKENYLPPSGFDYIAEKNKETRFGGLTLKIMFKLLIMELPVNWENYKLTLNAFCIIHTNEVFKYYHRLIRRAELVTAKNDILFKGDTFEGWLGTPQQRKKLIKGLTDEKWLPDDQQTMETFLNGKKAQWLGTTTSLLVLLKKLQASKFLVDHIPFAPFVKQFFTEKKITYLQIFHRCSRE